MKSVLRMYLLLFAALVLLVLASGCRQSEVPETVPVALPTFAPPLSMKTLSSAEIQQLDAFQVQLQKIDRDWDQFQRDFDSWRAALTSCSRNAAEEALQSFAVDFNAITEQARDLSRSEVTRTIADSLIDASESEETAFRQLRDRWQPNSPSVFESVEKSRSQSARIQREARDKSEELKDNLEDKTDPDALTEVMEFSDSFGLIEVEWTKLHDEYAVYWQVSETLGSEIEASKLESILERLASLFVEVDSLPEPAALREELESLRRAANSESSALEELLEVLTIGKQETRALPVVPATPSMGPPSRPVTLPLETVDDAFRASEATIRDTKNNN